MTQDERREYLIQYLLKEEIPFGRQNIPTDRHKSCKIAIFHTQTHTFDPQRARATLNGRKPGIALAEVVPLLERGLFLFFNYF